MSVSAKPLRLDLPDTLRSARFHIQARAQTAVAWPQFAGSTLRGAFGHALRRLACITRQPECSACPLLRSCPYPRIFESPSPVRARRTYSRIPPGFVLQPPPAGERLIKPGECIDYHIVLLDHAIEDRPLVAAAMAEALKKGVGKGNGSLQMQSFAQIDTDSADRPYGDGRIDIELLTPVHVKRHGNLLGPSQWQPATFIDALVRRLADLIELRLGLATGWDFPAIKAASASMRGEAALQWQAWPRYSSRQQRAMQLPGVTGTLSLHGDHDSFQKLLMVGESMHVGNKTSFGLGRYRINHATTLPTPKKSTTTHASDSFQCNSTDKQFEPIPR